MHNITIDQLKQLIASKLDMNLQLGQIGEDVPLLGDGLNLDSLAIVELITLIEDRFGIEFGEADLNMEAFANLRSLAQVIHARQGNGAPNAIQMRETDTAANPSGAMT